MAESSTTPTNAELIAEKIREKLNANLSIHDLVIQDKSGGCGQSFLVVVVA